ncbi:MAG TPA: hypothetical protein ENI15_16305 [Spirochaetes bacterium]|nr:hypothetical protein [Spirochaetota bacterium]
MYYKPEIDASVERFKKLWARDAPDRILVKIDIQDPENPTVMKAMEKVPDKKAMVDEWEKGFELNMGIADDNLPVVYGEFGGYIIGGFLGADVSWGAGGAYPDKLIPDMKDFRKYLHFDENNEYYRMQMGFTKYLAERSKGRFNFYHMWTPGETIFVSVDAYGQCGPVVFESSVEFMSRG